MTDAILQWITNVMQTAGYPGLVFAMIAENVIAPIPSEVLLPFAGFLVSNGSFTFFGALFWSVVGSMTGLWISYAIGRFGGRPFINRFGKYFFIKEDQLEQSEQFFNRYGQHIIILTRFIPVVRSFISIPAGMAKMNIVLFSFYSVIGLIMWNGVLIFIGMKLGEQWETSKEYMHYFDQVIIVAAIVFVGVVAVNFFMKYSKKQSNGFAE